MALYFEPNCWDKDWFYIKVENKEDFEYALKMLHNKGYTCPNGYPLTDIMNKNLYYSYILVRRYEDNTKRISCTNFPVYMPYLTYESQL